jgi:hypothetical protein
MEGLQEMRPNQLVNLILKAGIGVWHRIQFRKLVARLIGSSLRHRALMSVFQKRYVQPRRLAFTGLLEMARVQRLIPQNTDVAMMSDMLSGTVIYHLLFDPEKQSDAKVRKYLLKLLRQAGFRIPK